MTEKPDHYARVIARACGQAWAILPTKLMAIAALLELRANGLTLTDEDIRARLGGDPPEPRRKAAVDRVGVLPLVGVIAQHMDLLTDMSGGTSTDRFAADFRALRDDPEIKAIVIPIDSPGGGVYGVDELAAEIRASRGAKPIVAVADSQAASAAYWIASAADRFVVTPGGDVGSIGVLGLHTDLSGAQEKAGMKTRVFSFGKYKAENNPFAPLTEESAARQQARVDAIGERFVHAVAENRRVPVATVRSGYGEGRLLNAKEALAAGMVDEIDTLDHVIERLRERPTTRAIARAAALSDPLQATSHEPSPATGHERAADRLWQQRMELDLLEL